MTPMTLETGPAMTGSGPTVVDMTQACREAYYHDGPTACMSGQRHAFANARHDRTFLRSVKVAKGKGFKKPIYRDEYETVTRTLDGFFHAPPNVTEYRSDDRSKLFVCVHCGITASVTANRIGARPSARGTYGESPAKLVGGGRFQFKPAERLREAVKQLHEADQLEVERHNVEYAQKRAASVVGKSVTELRKLMEALSMLWYPQ